MIIGGRGSGGKAKEIVFNGFSNILDVESFKH